MKLCRTRDGRIGLVGPAGAVDVTSALGVLPSARYPYPTQDALVANLDMLRPLFAEIARTGAMIEPGTPLDSPIANPGKLVAAPVNYQRHLDEVREQADLHHNNAAHMRQIQEIGLFLKAGSSLIGPGEPVRIVSDRRVDHEIELAVVIGRGGKDIPAARALEHVAGYTIGLDMTVRGPEDRSFRKSLDTFTVLGPWLVTTDEIPDPGALALELRVNDTVRQQANTRDLVLDVPALIAFASSYYTLHPGDVILTGTPEGVGPVQPGDVIDARIEGLGSMRVDVVAFSAAQEVLNG